MNCALTMVLATDPTSVATPKLFRSYKTFGQPDADMPIWQVALAVIATPLDLDPVTFQGGPQGTPYTCIASSLAGLSNPSWSGLIEARERFLPDSVHTILNIGCGGIISSPWPARLCHWCPLVRGIALTKMAIGQVNDAKRAAVQMGSHRQMLEESANADLYFQYFSAPTVDAPYYDWSERTRAETQRRTIEYLEGLYVTGQIQAIAKKLVRLQDLPTQYLGESM